MSDTPVVSARDGYGVALKEIGKKNPQVCVLDADLSGATLTEGFAALYPDRFFNVGIAEQDLVGTAAGLALVGYVPIASSFALFLAGRAYDQVRNSIGYPRLNVKLIASHAGLMVGRDGASHQSFEDIALMRMVPGMTVVSPADYWAAQALIPQLVDRKGPCYCRLSRLKVVPNYTEGAAKALVLGKGNVVEKGKDVAILTHGIILEQAIEAARLLREKGIAPTVIDMHTIKPLDTELLAETLKGHSLIVTAEDHSVIGGLGGAVAEFMAETGAGSSRVLRRVGMRDVYGESGEERALLRKYGMDAAAIAGLVLKEAK